MHNILKKFRFVLLVSIVLRGGLSGLDALSLSEAIKSGLENSTSLTKTKDALEKAKLALDGSASLWGSNLSSSVSLPNGSLSSSLSLPIVPQLSLGARLDANLGSSPQSSGSSATSELTGSASLTVRPFADTSQSDSRKLAFDQALLDYNKAAVNAEVEVATVYAAAVKARSDRDIARKQLDRAIADVAWKEKLAAAGGLRSQELSAARLTLSDAYKTLTDAERADLKARYDLSAMIGIDVASLDAQLSAVDSLSESATNQIDPESVAELAKVLTVNTGVAKAQRNLDAQTAFSFPSVLNKNGVSAELQLPFQNSANGNLDWSLTFGIQFNASAFSGFDEATAKIDLAASRRDLESAKASAVQDRQLAILEYKLSVQLLSSAKQQNESAAANLAEAQLRNKTGDISDLELGDYELAADQARSALVAAQYELLIARMKVEALVKA